MLLETGEVLSSYGPRRADSFWDIEAESQVLAQGLKRCKIQGVDACH